MKVVRSEAHLGHVPAGELHDGQMVPPFECPERVGFIIDALAAAGFDDVSALKAGESSPSAELLAAVHDPGYLRFLETAWTQWTALGRSGDMIPLAFPGRRSDPSNVARVPEHIVGQLGWYSFAADTALTAGTWQAVLGAASLAHHAQRLVSGGADSAFALCRPPGHHAGADSMGGYSYLNNAAIAAQGFLNDGAQRVAVLDVDFHHGNGTQDIFYRRDDVLFASLHGDPTHEFPFFSGWAEEVGDGPGVGFNLNYPLAPGTSFERWFETLRLALDRITAFGPDALVVSLGVDTFEADPISSFTLTSEDFSTYGRAIGILELPTVYCMEGGYAVEAIGTNTVNVLTGHLQV